MQEDEQGYIQDIAEMRSMMERSSKFMSLSGLAGVMAGIYALAGAWIAWQFFGFNPEQLDSNSTNISDLPPNLLMVIFLSIIVLILSIGTAVFLSYRNAHKRGEKFWNSTAKRLLINMTIPLLAGGLLILILLTKGLIGFIAPFSLLFYGLALYNASKYTYEEVRSLGLIEIALGLTGCLFVEYGLLCWAAGFGLVHIIYGIYMHYRYER
ncbi:hypothetical protein D3H65_15810 [Paraflavitalea soli]|uniref:DUF973 family protein n=1 Tax=Paraflavitalea soli TaxID=2315862 RepID=A0A3B7MPW6_9BACT|nr:hypothetical protein [Paraflavitalea soli]AXY75359.1 hypothetical protein D3H65_15810 [Paraflavitalea soli]